jgi:hypothetical protein
MLPVAPVTSGDDWFVLLVMGFPVIVQLVRRMFPGS